MDDLPDDLEEVEVTLVMPAGGKRPAVVSSAEGLIKHMFG